MIEAWDYVGWVVAGGAGSAVSGWIARRRYHNTIREYEYGTARLQADRAVAQQKLFDLRRDIDKVVEKKFRERLAEWNPDQDDIEADFRKAEYMAEKREMLDAGRLHPPVVKDGEPARISRVSFSHPKSKGRGRN
ncbi:hypothetical protein BI084_gp53 [Gordonia phage Terapin]|uniref:Uncharacterized protein n=5 Tax=Terapinvirus terapin TaxID=2734283 RepID=A0A345MB92_9CAUD|nr:hypothetical protein BI084_gp53 [Gordonia phage Terapin]AVP43329.1 hypothetical protein PBI_DJOKOVIC_52 [Gordonia phage Djokovic]AXH67763.1 hypothetical protein SEA_BEYONCAGE_52 [Gordonia phage Beyoncage]QOC56197.1 membrane protein [Gordonia phage Sienna]QOC56622.1 membrane protein [Gordonia phage BiteSize]QYW00855.1 hypothetical protein SEA_MADI_52 [Gordonia phage Madi]